MQTLRSENPTASTRQHRAIYRERCEAVLRTIAGCVQSARDLTLSGAAIDAMLGRTH